MWKRSCILPGSECRSICTLKNPEEYLFFWTNRCLECWVCSSFFEISTFSDGKLPSKFHFDCVTSLTSRVDPVRPPEVLTLPFSLLAEEASTRTHFLLVEVNGSHFQTNILAYFSWKRIKCCRFCNSSGETEHSVVFLKWPADLYNANEHVSYHESFEHFAILPAMLNSCTYS